MKVSLSSPSSSCMKPASCTKLSTDSTDFDLWVTPQSIYLHVFEATKELLLNFTVYVLRRKKMFLRR